MEKVKEEEFRSVCKLAQLVERNAKLPTYVTKDQLEGLELNAGKIISFWIKNPGKDNQEKLYNEPINDKQIIAVIGTFAEPQRPAQLPEKTIISTESNTALINSIPDILEEKRIITPFDIEEWKKLSAFDRILLFQKTPKNLVKKRRGYLLPEFAGRDRKTLTDENFKMFQYLDATTMKHSANIAFLFQWTSVVESEHYFEAAGEVCVRGYIEVEINGKTYRRACGGSGIKKGMMDWGDTMESAISEMTKRGIYHFLHGDVKRGEFECQDV